MKPSVLLISFYNQKALGVRYLEAQLVKSGFDVSLVFFKGFHSLAPKEASDVELELLKNIIKDKKPTLIGLSVMTSLYLDTVNRVNGMIRRHFTTPILWGGVYATLFPDECLKKADFVLRGEGEYAICELVQSIAEKTNYENILNLSYVKNSKVVKNDVRSVEQNLDTFGYPSLGGVNKYFINNDSVINQDPQLDALSYELTASRGCPFACSYCCSVNIHRVYKGKGQYLRFRSVGNVMEELLQAKKKVKRLKVIHFWDEIFSDEPEWIDEFAKRYKKEIGLPFEIWGHPLKVDEAVLKKLVKAGLYKVVMGIQSGSQRVRKEVFHRVETQQEIIHASEILQKAKVPQVIFDFMLQHPFETDQDIKETYEMCKKLARPFELQLHGLCFLPGTDIVKMAVDKGIYTDQEIHDIMYAPMQELYNMYWRIPQSSEMSKFWYAMTFMTQFLPTYILARVLEKHTSTSFVRKIGMELFKIAKPLKKTRYVYKKGILICKSVSVKIKEGYLLWLATWKL